MNTVICDGASSCASVFQRRASVIAIGALALSLPLFASSGSVAHAQEAATQSAGSGRLVTFPNSTGEMGTLNVNGRTDRRGPFFRSLGTNGRTCDSCHTAEQGMSITPSKIRELFDQTRGHDPLFAPVDGANCQNVQRGDRRGHSLLLNHGLIRIGLSIPANAQFRISVVNDPYGCAIVKDRKTGLRTVSVYRRPLPATNLAFSSAVMWDARETVAPLDDGATFLQNLRSNLARQALNATTGHAEAAIAPRPDQLDDIVDFELGLFSAQTRDNFAGKLDRAGGLGGPTNLSNQEFYPLINDVIGFDPTGAFYTPEVMNLFTAWGPPPASANAARASGGSQSWEQLQADARRDIAAGEQLFNLAPLNITTTRGLNDFELGENGVGPESPGSTCTTCHDTPNVASMSRALLMDIGVGHARRPESDPQIKAGLAKLDQAPELPLFLIEGCQNPFYPGQPVSFYTSDPGRALITGLCSDLNRVKVPMLRGLAGRAPYFHNGSAATLKDVVEFYDKRFQMNLTPEQRRQLVAFLNSL